MANHRRLSTFCRALGASVIGLAGLLATAGPVVADEPVKTPVFTKDIAPIFQDKCQACHRPGYIAPMSLVTYEETRPWARSIKARVAARQMPPWHIDPTVGIQHFKNDRSLTDGADRHDRALGRRRCAAGRPEGHAAAEAICQRRRVGLAPALRRTAGSDHQVAAVHDAGAGARPVVQAGRRNRSHRGPMGARNRDPSCDGEGPPNHAPRAGATAAGRSRQRLPADDGDADAGLFMEWAVGKQGEIMRPNSGKLMLPGSRIVFEVHYHAVGEEITDQVELGIYFYPKGQEPKYRQVLASLSSVAGGARNIDIPPNGTFVSQNFHVMNRPGESRTSSRTCTCAARRCRWRRSAERHDADAQPREQLQFQLAQQLHLRRRRRAAAAEGHDPEDHRRGTTTRRRNKNNPDPNQWVGFGDRTVDEMGHAWMNITYMTDEEFQGRSRKEKGLVSSVGALWPEPSSSRIGGITLASRR